MQSLEEMFLSHFKKIQANLKIIGSQIETTSVSYVYNN